MWKKHEKEKERNTCEQTNFGAFFTDLTAAQAGKPCEKNFTYSCSKFCVVNVKP